MENLINGTVPVSRRQILSPEGLSVCFVVRGLWSVIWAAGDPRRPWSARRGPRRLVRQF